MSISKKNCPVPFDQQPLNEYFALKESILFAWSMYSLKTYVLITFCIFFFFLTFIYFFLILYGLPYVSFLNKILVNILFTDSIIILFFVRLYLGWSYIVKRLLSTSVFYEESGWYDGQIWIKTTESLTQDRLVGLYQVKPLINRIKYTILIFLFIFLFFIVLFITNYYANMY
uniref:Ycf36 n=1 Tax=Spyridia filamentosa TaxID=196632 RepID=A0A1Z1MJH5_SPYFI|nr:hypothetical protein [Spyridia filamentosa]ARW66230.1 hypothetical protein [Spyridia filamentosa]